MAFSSVINFEKKSDGPINENIGKAKNNGQNDHYGADDRNSINCFFVYAFVLISGFQVFL